jgi:hypothetical protein
MSQASASSEPWPRARPRSLATLTTRDCANRVTNFGHALNSAAPGCWGIATVFSLFSWATSWWQSSRVS